MRAANEVLFWSGSGRASCRVVEVAAPVRDYGARSGPAHVRLGILGATCQQRGYGRRENLCPRSRVLLVTYIGGAVFVSRQPGYGFWDGVVWVYYVGRYIAKQYAAL
jgi:hypothetical protein